MIIFFFFQAEDGIRDLVRSRGLGDVYKRQPMHIVAEREREHAAGGDWRHRAACLEEDPELFFPIGNTGPALVQIEEAKAVCAGCPVRETCLTWALESGQDSGVWGGMSEDERRALKRRHARAPRRGAGA